MVYLTYYLADWLWIYGAIVRKFLNKIEQQHLKSQFRGKMKKNSIKMVNSTLFASTLFFAFVRRFWSQFDVLVATAVGLLFNAFILLLAFNRKYTNYKVKWINVCIGAHKAKKRQWINNITFTFIQCTLFAPISLCIECSASLWYNLTELLASHRRARLVCVRLFASRSSSSSSFDVQLIQWMSF